MWHAREEARLDLHCLLELLCSLRNLTNTKKGKYLNFRSRKKSSPKKEIKIHLLGLYFRALSRFVFFLLLFRFRFSSFSNISSLPFVFFLLFSIFALLLFFFSFLPFPFSLCLFLFFGLLTARSSSSRFWRSFASFAFSSVMSFETYMNRGPSMCAT